MNVIAKTNDLNKVYRFHSISPRFIINLPIVTVSFVINFICAIFSWNSNSFQIIWNLLVAPEFLILFYFISWFPMHLLGNICVIFVQFLLIWQSKKLGFNKKKKIRKQQKLDRNYICFWGWNHWNVKLLDHRPT